LEAALTNPENDKKNPDVAVHHVIGELASTVANGSGDTVGNVVAGIVVGGTLYGGYHAGKFTVRQAKKQSKHLKAAIDEIKEQAEGLLDGAEQVKSQAEGLATKVVRRRKKKGDPEDFPRL
jgi:hypothetical protein